MLFIHSHCSAKETYVEYFSLNQPDKSHTHHLLLLRLLVVLKISSKISRVAESHRCLLGRHKPGLVTGRVLDSETNGLEGTFQWVSFGGFKILLISLCRIRFPMCVNMFCFQVNVYVCIWLACMNR